ncbi:hypothetical protein ACUOFU_16785 [Microbacterium arabinogalactanolyticum]|uniref:hypothetical protein n=1 Tax=Microbacterium arabinogalactanolyticum TaxID=69365 RepID=UPI004044D3CC
MTASAILATGASFDTGITRPRHPLLAAGTLALIEAGDPLKAITGIPAALPNLASKVVAARAAGAGADWAYAEPLGAGRWTRSRTPGGGIKGISAGAGVSGRARYNAPTALNTFIKSIRGRQLVWYMVGRVTAIPTATFTGRQAMFEWFNYNSVPATGAGGVQFYAQFDQAPSPAGTAWIRLYNNQGTGGTIAANGYTTGGVAWAGGALRVPVGATFTIVAAYSDLQSTDLQAMLGWSTAATDGWGLDHYLAGIEDVQTTGRPWTDVLALAEQWRQEECETPGGRYHAD